MDSNIAQALQKMFDKHRIVFWYDEKKELRSDYDNLNLDDVVKLEIQNNELTIKYHILREKPLQKFLVYKSGPQPPEISNWLLDVQLSHAEFRTDQCALWLGELELGPEFSDLVQNHQGFYSSAKRREALKSRLKPDDTALDIRLKMGAVCCGTATEARIDTILESFLQEHGDERDDKFTLLSKSGLDDFFWQQMERVYGYRSSSPSIADFAIELFKSCYALELQETARLRPEALVFLNRWKDSISQKTTFEKLSEKSATVLNIEQDLLHRDMRQLGRIDFFELIDRKVISDLTRQLCERTITLEQCQIVIRARRNSHWHDRYSDFFDALDYASQFFNLLKDIDLQIGSAENGYTKYVSTWYKVDQLYRTFFFHFRKSSQTILKPLAEQIENFYSNSYLMPLGDLWQTALDRNSSWDIAGVTSQRQFFNHEVKPFLDANKKVAVIISDALRYECGEELWRKIRQENRYEARLSFMQSALPSYTQLGMASLLPNKEIAIAENDSGTVLVDGQSSVGTANRAKILQAAVPGGAQAISAEEFLKLNKEESRALVRDNEVLYVYHNRIDSVGDKKDAEGRVFEAVNDTIQELLVLVKRLAASNFNNMIITADHGFIYQNNELDESDFAAIEINDPNILYQDRRFLLGRNLQNHPSLMSLSSSQAGLAGEMEIRIPRSICRLRLRGSGSRFVHGGATLQETVIPVITINKKRGDDIEPVSVEVLKGSTSTITSGQLTVVFFQEQPVTEKMPPRCLRAGIYSKTGELISDSHELTFDSPSTDPRDRETPVRFVLSSKADMYNNQEVVLKAEEREGKTSHFKEYRTVRYLLRRSFTSDFDF